MMKNYLLIASVFCACSFELREIGDGGSGTNPNLGDPDSKTSYQWPDRDSESSPDTDGRDIGTDRKTADLGAEVHSDSGSDLGHDLGVDAGADSGPSCGGNLIPNGDCEAGGPTPSGWTLLVTGSAGASYSRDCEMAHSGECSCRVDVAVPGDEDDVRLEHPDINVPAGTYEVCFSARSADTTIVHVDGPIEIDGLEIRTEWTEFCAELEIMNPWSGALRFLVDAEHAPMTVWFDSASLRSCP